MSQEAEDRKEVELLGRRYTVDDVLSFLSEKAPYGRCPACSSVDWQVVMSPGELSYMALPSEGKLREGYHYPVFGALCANCGFIRLHAWAILAAWKKRMEAQGNATT